MQRLFLKKDSQHQARRKIQKQIQMQKQNKGRNMPSFIASKLEKKKMSEISNQTFQESQFQFSSHPAYKHIGDTSLCRTEFYKFANLLYHGILYSIKTLKGPSTEYLNKKSVLLKEDSSSQKLLTSYKNVLSQTKNKGPKKFLMLDLDETLIHSIFDRRIPADVRIVESGSQFRFNVRPYCFSFLEKMSEIYDVYVFTASTKDYAEPIVKYLNKDKFTIKQVLHRKNCMETMSGFKIKDLRIIKNRPLSEIVLIDNLAHSFGLQIDNGVPILEFIDNKDDKELLKLEKMLIQMNQYSDVRDYIKQKINILDCLDYEEKQYLDLDQWRQDQSSKLKISRLALNGNS